MSLIFSSLLYAMFISTGIYWNEFQYEDYEDEMRSPSPPPVTTKWERLRNTVIAFAIYPLIGIILHYIGFGTWITSTGDFFLKPMESWNNLKVSMSITLWLWIIFKGSEKLKNISYYIVYDELLDKEWFRRTLALAIYPLIGGLCIAMSDFFLQALSYLLSHIGSFFLIPLVTIYNLF